MEHYRVYALCGACLMFTVVILIAWIMIVNPSRTTELAVGWFAVGLCGLAAITALKSFPAEATKRASYTQNQSREGRHT